MNDTLSSPEDVFFELKLADRCDACPNHSSQAFAIAYKEIEGKVLSVYLCGHHLARNEVELISQGFHIQDERYRINEKPQSGAPEDYYPAN